MRRIEQQNKIFKIYQTLAHSFLKSIDINQHI